MKWKAGGCGWAGLGADGPSSAPAWPSASHVTLGTSPQLSEPAAAAASDTQGSSTPLLLLSRFSRVRLCAIPSLGFSRQEHWSGVPLPSPHTSLGYYKVREKSKRVLKSRAWTLGSSGCNNHGNTALPPESGNEQDQIPHLHSLLASLKPSEFLFLNCTEHLLCAEDSMWGGQKQLRTVIGFLVAPSLMAESSPTALDS